MNKICFQAYLFFQMPKDSRKYNELQVSRVKASKSKPLEDRTAYTLPQRLEILIIKTEFNSSFPNKATYGLRKFPQTDVPVYWKKLLNQST